MTYPEPDLTRLNEKVRNLETQLQGAYRTIYETGLLHGGTLQTLERFRKALATIADRGNWVYPPGVHGGEAIWNVDGKGGFVSEFAADVLSEQA